ncbi:MAG: hypothetical protein ACYDB1_00140 [Acidiferrobacteraceae bacterium]
MRATAGGLVRTRLLGMAGAYGVGYHTVQRADAARQAMIDANARTVSAWAKTAEGRQVYAWARLNALGLRALCSPAVIPDGGASPRTAIPCVIRMAGAMGIT